MSDLVNRSRGATYTLLIGLVSGLFLAGLVVPYVFGKRPTDVLTTSSGLSPNGLTPALSSDPGAAGGTPTTGRSAGPAGGGGSVGTTGAVVGGGTTGGQAGGSTGSLAAGSSGGNTNGGAKLTATDQGVTARTIKLGLGILDTGNVSKFAPAGSSNDNGDNIQKQKNVWKALLAWINSEGGLYGRTLIPDFVTFDPLSVDSMRQACITWTENDKVFAVASDTYYGDPIQCVAAQHRVPFITNTGGQSTEYSATKGYNLALAGDGDRLLANLVYQLQIRNLLKGHKIGILDDASSKFSVDRGMKPALQKAGVTITDEETLPDNQTGTSAIVTAQQSMQAKGVDLVLPALNVIEIGIFAQQGQSNGWNPQYYVSDFEGDATDAATIFYSNFVDKNMVAFAAFREGESKANLPEPAMDAACRINVEKRTGLVLARGTVDYQGVMDNCNFIELYARMVHDAGPDLTRPKAIAAFHQLQNVSFAYMGGTQSIRPGKDFGGDYVRPVQYGGGCKCWTAIGNFTKGAY